MVEPPSARASRHRRPADLRYYEARGYHESGKDSSRPASFRKGDIVALRDPSGSELARALTNYSADDVRRIRGLRSGEIAEALGHCPYEEASHRDNMVVTA